MDVLTLKDAIDIYGGVDVLSREIGVSINNMRFYARGINTIDNDKIDRYFQKRDVVIVPSGQLELTSLLKRKVNKEEFIKDLESMYTTYEDYLRYAKGDLEANNEFLFNLYYLFHVKYKLDINLTSLLKAFPFLSRELWIINLTEKDMKKWLKKYTFPDFYGSLTRVVKEGIRKSNESTL